MPADPYQPVVITHRGRTDYQASVTPGCGANLVSFRADGTEYIHYDETLLKRDGRFTGAFNMFPAPCRLADCAYTFEGRRISQTKRGKPVFIHGLVRDEAFKFKAEPDKITSWIDIDAQSPLYEGFPFTCSFRVIHQVGENGLTVTFQVINKDVRRIPFGYGIHPYWQLHGTRDQVRLRIPCDRMLESKELVPTGNTLPVEGSPFDFRELKPLGNLLPDHVFWKPRWEDPAEIRYDALDKKIIIESDPHFAHMIAYTAAGSKFVCVENLTACPNAQNIVAASGVNTMANLLIAAPGETVEGWVRYSVRPSNG
jgi:aldose 1-epimerase